MIEFIIKYWVEFLFGIIATGAAAIAKRFYSLYKNEKKNSRILLPYIGCIISHRINFFDLPGIRTRTLHEMLVYGTCWNRSWGCHYPTRAYLTHEKMEAQWSYVPYITDSNRDPWYSAACTDYWRMRRDWDDMPSGGLSMPIYYL